MKRFLKSKIALSLAAFLMIAAAIVVPLAGSIRSSHAAPPPPFALPTEGYLGVCWNDPGFTHTYNGVQVNHEGIDVWSNKDQPEGPLKNPVYAVYGGTVATVEPDVGRVQINLDPLPSEYAGIVPQLSGLQAYYVHLSKIDVTVNQHVVYGQPIGTQGDLGASGGIIHLHFSIKKGTSVNELDINNTWDPSPYLGMNLQYKDKNGPCGIGTKMWMEDFKRDSTPPSPRLDLAFVIDTTGSMGGEIDSMKNYATSIIGSLKNSVDTQIAVEDFKDFPVYPYGDPSDYPYRNVLPFTSDRSKAISAIQSLTVGGGADTPESDYCALMHATRDDKCAGYGANTTTGYWRSGSKKAIIWITDAPPLDPEPFTNFKADDVINALKSFVVLQVGGGDGDEFGPPPGSDPINVYSIPVGSDPGALAAATTIATGSGGKVFSASTPDDVVNSIEETLGEIEGDTTSPVLSLPGTITVNATSPQGTTVNYTVTATDPDNTANELTINCSPVSGTIFPIGTTTVNCSASDPAGNTAVGSFKVVVKGASDQINDLINLVNSFNLSMGMKTSLDAKLHDALTAISTGDTSTACSDMTSFINEVKAQSGKAITANQANQLRDAATRIKAVLAC